MGTFLHVLSEHLDPMFPRTLCIRCSMIRTWDGNSFRLRHFQTINIQKFGEIIDEKLVGIYILYKIECQPSPVISP